MYPHCEKLEGSPLLWSNSLNMGCCSHAQKTRERKNTERKNPWPKEALDARISHRKNPSKRKTLTLRFTDF